MMVLLNSLNIMEILSKYETGDSNGLYFSPRNESHGGSDYVCVHIISSYGVAVGRVCLYGFSIITLVLSNDVIHILYR